MNVAEQMQQGQVGVDAMNLTRREHNLYCTAMQDGGRQRHPLGLYLGTVSAVGAAIALCDMLMNDHGQLNVTRIIVSAYTILLISAGWAFHFEQRITWSLIKKMSESMKASEQPGQSHPTAS